MAIADPLGAPEELLVSLTADAQWQSTALELVHAAVTPEHQQYAPTFALSAPVES